MGLQKSVNRMLLGPDQLISREIAPYGQGASYRVSRQMVPESTDARTAVRSVQEVGVGQVEAYIHDAEDNTLAGEGGGKMAEG